MARSKKGKRSIIVNGQKFLWSATGNDGWINLIITEYEKGLSTVVATFDYHHITVGYDPNTGGTKTKQGFVITPSVVREVIFYALKNGWEPKKSAPEMNLGALDGKINLQGTTAFLNTLIN